MCGDGIHSCTLKTNTLCVNYISIKNHVQYLIALKHAGSTLEKRNIRPQKRVK